MRSFNCGGNYNNTANGLATFNGNNSRTNANANIGFRAASSPVRYCRLKGLLSVQDDKGICVLF